MRAGSSAGGGSGLEIERRQRPGAHDLVHGLGHRGDAEVQIQPAEHGDPRRELGDELERLTGVGVDQRFPARRVARRGPEGAARRECDAATSGWEPSWATPGMRRAACGRARRVGHVEQRNIQSPVVRGGRWPDDLPADLGTPLRSDDSQRLSETKQGRGRAGEARSDRGPRALARKTRRMWQRPGSAERCGQESRVAGFPGSERLQRKTLELVRHRARGGQCRLDVLLLWTGPPRGREARPRRAAR